MEEKARQSVERVADEKIAGLAGAAATHGPLPETAGAGGFLDLLTLRVYEQVP